jgi:hypothetical protein
LSHTISFVAGVVAGFAILIHERLCKFRHNTSAILFVTLNASLSMRIISSLWLLGSISGTSFKISCQLFCVGHAIEVRSPGKDKNWQVVGKLP